MPKNFLDAPGRRYSRWLCGLAFALAANGGWGAAPLSLVGSGTTCAADYDTGTLHAFVRNDTASTVTLSEAFLSTDGDEGSADPQLSEGILRSLKDAGAPAPASTFARLSQWGRALPWQISPGGVSEIRLKPREQMKDGASSLVLRSAAGDREKFQISSSPFTLVVRAVRPGHRQRAPLRLCAESRL